MNPRKEPLSALVREGLAHHRAGRIEDAERAYRAQLARAPLHPEALHYLGLVLHQKGKFQDSADTLALAAGPLKGDADFHANYGLALKDANYWTRAKAEYGHALALRPDHPGATFNLGLLLGEEGDLEGAAARFRRLAQKEPRSAEARCFLGPALAEQGQTAEARAALQEAVRLDPGYALAWTRLAELELEAGDCEAANLDPGDLDAALAAATKAAEAAPGDFETAVLLAEVRERRGDKAARDQALARARAIEPEAVRYFFTLGIELYNRGLVARARRALRRGLLFDPDYILARWTLPRLVPHVYADDAEIDRVRRDYQAGLDAIEGAPPLDTPEKTRDAFIAVSAMTNFYLAYQERNDRDLQICFGRIARKVIAARFPELADNPTPRPGGGAIFDARGDSPARPPDPGRKLRVGFLSAYFRLHVVSRLCIGWLEKLDRRRFEVFGYHTGSERDNVTKLVASQCDTFRHLPIPPVPARDQIAARETWFTDVARAIAADRLDALIFTDLGMNNMTFMLAALRLAPVQATAIGHPVTTGLPTIDYFLSGELVEGPGGDAHYSERLVRLPNISIRLFDPNLAKGGRKSLPRESFGVGADEVVFLCSQSIFKYLPRYDRIYPAIAKAVPNAKLVFIRSPAPERDIVFLARLARAFAQEGLDRDQRCLFLDRLSPKDFVALHHIGDVFLDTPGWSGGTTTHEAIAAGLPIVTLPGEFMRGRVTHGMLRMIGVEETIAKDIDDYIAIAVRLGKEPEFRARVRGRIEANRHRLYQDEACVRGLEDFLVKAVARARAEG